MLEIDLKLLCFSTWPWFELDTAFYQANVTTLHYSHSFAQMHCYNVKECLRNGGGCNNGFFILK